MAEVRVGTLYRVDIMEYERGWGSKLDEKKFFDNEAEARKFCADYNAKNSETRVPDWYMVADYRGKVS